MDLFGIKEQDERLDNMERYVRRLVEQVAQLSIDLGVTRTQLRAVQVQVEAKVEAGDVDPAMVRANDLIGEARVKLQESQEAAADAWDGARSQLDDVLVRMREALDAESDG